LGILLRRASKTRVCNCITVLKSRAPWAFICWNRSPTIVTRNLGWSIDAGALTGHPAADDPSYQAAIRVADLTVLLLDSGGRTANTFRLSGTNLHEGYEWLASAIESFTGKPLSSALAPPPFELPFHAVAADGTISGDPKEAFEELSRWYSNADKVLSRVSGERENSSDVRCWPHHFDIATLIQIDPYESPEQARSIGVGMSQRFRNQHFWSAQTVDLTSVSELLAAAGRFAFASNP